MVSWTVSVLVFKTILQHRLHVSISIPVIYGPLLFSGQGRLFSLKLIWFLVDTKIKLSRKGSLKSIQRRKSNFFYWRQEQMQDLPQNSFGGEMLCIVICMWSRRSLHSNPTLNRCGLLVRPTPFFLDKNRDTYSHFLLSWNLQDEESATTNFLVFVFSTKSLSFDFFSIALPKCQALPVKKVCFCIFMLNHCSFDCPWLFFWERDFAGSISLTAEMQALCHARHQFWCSWRWLEK